ncbi:MmyB family transcriptional regulator [Streptomyces sp. CB00455]|uniref:MmyB family transcriptional regulator n=1 Tax=Streptomyces sp. CB00455 TaxID=1703927 RepID=UPI0013010E0F
MLESMPQAPAFAIGRRRTDVPARNPLVAALVATLVTGFGALPPERRDEAWPAVPDPEVRGRCVNRERKAAMWSPPSASTPGATPTLRASPRRSPIAELPGCRAESSGVPGPGGACAKPRRCGRRAPRHRRLPPAPPARGGVPRAPARA